MGGNQSAEANGIEGCSGCDVHLPPANPNWDFVKACEANPNMKTFCFWTRAEYPEVVSAGISVGQKGDTAEFGLKGSVQTTIGEKLFKYFRIYTQRDQHRYWCSECFAINRPKIATSVFLELSGKGKIISKDMKLVQMGSQ
ncbi:Hypothetical predicted protein [Mytilus galloprovincialis]|uniref:Uncharacterized protein n=1 Tax=Mytilus galloprovincialis TaxID=29158 RepID=A0A8B6CH96_MYTGA|nr:Hypothetical predicted protein [Mytilus galloprovincialis]